MILSECLPLEPCCHSPSTQLPRQQLNAEAVPVYTPLSCCPDSRVQELCESGGGRPGLSVLLSFKPVLNWANVCSLNILRTVRRTMIRFLIELLVRRTWFGQFDKLCFILNWLVMRCKLRLEPAADAQQTA